MTNLFTKLSLKKRFFIIGIVFVSFSIYQIVSDSFSRLLDLNFSYNQHYHSLSNIRQVNKLILQIQKLRGLTNIYLSDKSFNHEIILSQEKKVIKELRKFLYGHQEHQDNYLYHELTLINKEILRLAKNNNKSAQQTFYNYTIVIDRLISTINIIANNIYLDKETPKTTKLLFELLINELPYIIENLGNSRGTTAGNIALNNKEKNQDITLFEKLILLDIKKINIKLMAISQTKESNQHSITEDLKHLEKISTDYLTLLHSQQIKETKDNSYIFYQYSTRLINQYNQIYNKLFLQLTQHIVRHYDNQRLELKTKIAIELVIFILSLLLFIYFYTTSLKYVNRIKKAEKAKSIFLSNMSHEIRTPLNAIIGFIKILQQNKDPENKERYLEIINKSSQQLLYIINDILDYSKIESKKLKLEIAPFDFKKEFTLLKELFEANAKEKDIALNLKIADDIPSCIKSDQFRLKQIISNLLSNAIKFTPPNGIVTLEAVSYNNQIRISVQDTGIGIAKNKQKSIFKNFSQADETTTRKFGGTGLGLAICSSLVSLLGSKLYLESTENKGSLFYFYLEIEECEVETTQTLPNYDEVSYKGNILVVEDNLTNQFLIQTTLESLNLQVTLANDGEEAIKIVEKTPFDLIFMDENMPNLNGIEATKIILQREKEQEKPHTPIIALTANAKQGDKERFLSAGMDDYLPKPFEHDQLHTILHTYLKISRTQ